MQCQAKGIQKIKVNIKPPSSSVFEDLSLLVQEIVDTPHYHVLGIYIEHTNQYMIQKL